MDAIYILFVNIIPCIVYIIFTLFDKSNNRGHKIKIFDQGLFLIIIIIIIVYSRVLLQGNHVRINKLMT